LKRILLIDNTFDPPRGSPEIRFNLVEAAAGVGSVDVRMVRGPDSEIPGDLDGFAGVVLSGSKTRVNETAAWIELEMDLIRQLYARKIPTLGICYGEQLIARALGGEECVGVASRSEHGWVEIERIGESKVLEGLPQSFYSFEYHSDEVKRLPANFRLTASSDACPVQAFDILDAPMWGIQFHPERDLEQGNRGLDKRLAEDPSFPALNRDKSQELYDPAVARTIFRNFLKQVWLVS
jgi:GMP synthase (glutamine-hydrolysing)